MLCASFRSSLQLPAYGKWMTNANASYHTLRGYVPLLAEEQMNSRGSLKA